MIIKSFEEVSNLRITIMNGKGLRRAVSDASAEITRLGKELETILELDENNMGVIMQAECECCNLKEECTQEYIARTKNLHSGKWVCGLCSEAVKEKLTCGDSIGVEEAVQDHRIFCQEYNSTTRMNPKLSLAWAMKNIAKKSYEHRRNKNPSASKIARTSSCIPRIGDMKNMH